MRLLDTKPSCSTIDSTKFKCLNKKKCVSSSRICDGDNDCGDNSDEGNICKGIPNNIE